MFWDCCEIYQKYSTKLYHPYNALLKGCVCVCQTSDTAIHQSTLTTQQHSTPVPMAIVCERMSDSIPSPNNNTTVQTVFVFAYYLSTPPNPPVFIALILLFQNCLS